MAPDTRIQVEGFGFSPVKVYELGNLREIVRRYTLTNENNASVQLISWGAGIQSIRIPNNKNILGDVVLGYDSLEGYLKNRYIGRIVNQFSESPFCDKQKCQLSRSDDNEINLNNGFCGFDNINWESHILGNQVMSLLNQSENEKYSSQMLIQVKYSWTNENELHINIRATSTNPTPANITNYCFFNLAGHATGLKELNNHIVTINADKWTENNLSRSILPVESTVYDLRRPTQLNKQKLYSVPGGGYNNDLCITSPSVWSYRFHARILHPSSGRFLEVYSNQPGLHFNTGNHFPVERKRFSSIWKNIPEGESQGQNLGKKMENEMRCKSGALYRRHCSFTLAPQNYSDDEKNFPSSILHPGQIYSHDMTYKFGVLQKC